MFQTALKNFSTNKTGNTCENYLHFSLADIVVRKEGTDLRAGYVKIGGIYLSLNLETPM